MPNGPSSTSKAHVLELAALDGIQPRTTRSKKIFSPWDICRVDLANPLFDLDLSLRKKVRQENENIDEFPDDLVELGEEEEPFQALEPTDPAGFSTEPSHSDDGSFDSWSCSSDDPTPSSSSHLQTTSQPPKKPAGKKKGKKTKPETNHKKRRNKSSHLARANKRARATFQPIQPRQSIVDRYQQPGPSVKSAALLDGTNVTSTGFVGRRERESSRTVHPLEYFVGKGSKLNFTFQEWNGKTPMALVDKNNRLIGVLAGHPDVDNWPTVHKEAANALKEARQRRTRPDSDTSRRGCFASLRCGVSHGGGQTEPGNLHNDPEAAQLIEELNSMPCFKRIANFASCVMATRAPRLYGYYTKKLGRLYSREEKLKPPFPNCVHAACTYNCGPQTVCCKHCDSGNLAFGMCAVTALGEFDYKKGGHLVLWPLRLVIEFPPGSTILIPSAIIAHSNTAISANEERYSFTQYTSGSLFRWIDNKYQKATTYRAHLSRQELEKVQARDAKRWQLGLSLLPIVNVA